MDSVEQIEGQLQALDRRFAIVASRFNQRIVERLVKGAVDALRRHGVEAENILLVRVPGAWELPLAVERLAAAKRHHGIVVLGAVIRGETPHFDYVAGEASSLLSRISLENEVPVGFGLLTCDTSSQAEERAGGKAGNKGWDAACAVLEMADVLSQLG